MIRAAAGGELVNQGLRNVIWRGGDNDQVERRMFRPALIAIPESHFDVLVSQTFQTLFCLVRQGLNNLDAVNMLDDFRQHRGLVTRPSADVQDPRVGLGTPKLSHQSHNVRLRNGLTVSDR